MARVSCSVEKDFICSTAVEVCGSAFRKSCSGTTGLVVCSATGCSDCSSLGGIGITRVWIEDEEILLKIFVWRPSKTLFFIRVFDVHYYSRKRSWNGWLYWFGRLCRSLSVVIRTLKVLDLEPLYGKVVIFIRAGGRTTLQCSTWESCSYCRGRGDLRNRRILYSTYWRCSFFFTSTGAVSCSSSSEIDEGRDSAIFFPFSFVPMAGLLRNLRLFFCSGIFLKPVDNVLKLSTTNALWSLAHIKIHITFGGNIKLLVDRKFKLMNLFFSEPDSSCESGI